MKTKNTQTRYTVRTGTAKWGCQIVPSFAVINRKGNKLCAYSTRAVAAAHAKFLNRK